MYKELQKKTECPLCVGMFVRFYLTFGKVRVWSQSKCTSAFFVDKLCSYLTDRQTDIIISLISCPQGDSVIARLMPRIFCRGKVRDIQTYQSMTDRQTAYGTIDIDE